jgi:hypothetical protein
VRQWYITSRKKETVSTNKEPAIVRWVINNEAKQWHTCSPEFIERMEAYCIKRSKTQDIWVQYYDGRFSITEQR